MKAIAQVTPSAVEQVSAGVADACNGSAATSGSDAASQSIIERGAVAHWEGFEAVCYDILYNQVLPCLPRSSLKPVWWTHQLLYHTAADILSVLQLGWEQGDEGSLLVAEPLFTSKANPTPHLLPGHAPVEPVCASIMSCDAAQRRCDSAQL